MKTTAFAIGQLLGLGVKDFVVCAGARNVYPAVILMKLAEQGEINVWRHFDERSAAFFALGLAKKDCRAVVVVTTSGTAVAEIFPAIIEAHYSAIPLIALTADRPRRFRKSGAPQAIEQKDIFGDYVSVSIDVDGVGDLDQINQWDGASPLHLNLCQEEPVANETVPGIEISEANPCRIPKSDPDELMEFLGDRSEMVAFVGDLAADDKESVAGFLKQLGIPTWFEAISGLREYHDLADQRISIESDLAEMKFSKVLRIGGVPSLRFWRDLETRDDIAVFSICPTQYPGLSEKRDLYQTQQGWVQHLTGLRGMGILPMIRSGRIDRSLKKHPVSEPAVIRALSEHIPSDSLVFLGNSMPIREWNLAASFAVPHPNCFANRGANGIDGEISTFFGLCQDVGAEESWGVFGDLTTLYDLNAPYVLDQLSEQKSRIRIVVLNNGGGRIFSRLPSMAGFDEKQKHLTENHHQIKFRHWAAMWGMEYVRWNAGDEIPEIEGAAVLIEVVLDNEMSEGFWADLWHGHPAHESVENRRNTEGDEA